MYQYEPVYTCTCSYVRVYTGMNQFIYQYILVQLREWRAVGRGAQGRIPAVSAGQGRGRADGLV